MIKKIPQSNCAAKLHILSLFTKLSAIISQNQCICITLQAISEEKLIMVDKAEQLLLDMGFHQVRVRIHGTIARIEILPEEFPKLVEETNRNLITKSFKEYGFTYVTMDLTGYRTGSMNETLNSDL